MNKAIFFGIIAYSALILSCSKQPAQTNEQKEEITAQASQEFVAISTATDLAKYGYEAKQRSVVCVYDSLVNGYQIAITMTEDTIIMDDEYYNYVQAVIKLIDSTRQIYTIQTPMRLQFSDILPADSSKQKWYNAKEVAFSLDTIHLTYEEGCFVDSLYYFYKTEGLLMFADIDFDGQKEILIDYPYPYSIWAATYLGGQYLIFKKDGDSFIPYSYDDFLGDGASDNTRIYFSPSRKIIALSYRGENIDIYKKNPNTGKFELKRSASNVRYDDTIYIYEYWKDSCVSKRTLLNPCQIYYWQKYSEIHEMLMEGL